MSNNLASDIFPETNRKDTVDDLLGANFDEQPPPVSKEPIKRDQDSTDDFEHLEQEYSNLRESRPPNLDVATKNLLDTSIPAFETDLRPVPATPPPSANSEESDPFQRDTKTLPMDPKAASLAFVETERGIARGEELETKNKEDPFGKFDFNPSQPKEDVLLPKDAVESKDSFKTDLLKDSHDLDFLEKMDVKKDVKEHKDEEDDTWNLVGKSKFDEPPTKPLPPLPKGAEFESLDPYEKSSAQDKYQMTSELLTEESMKKAGQSGYETGDSEFESEPEPSPAKSVSKGIKTEVRQPEDICPRVPERKTRVVDEIAPKEIFGNLGLVAALIYWRDPKKSGIVFGVILGVLLSLAYFSLISVLAYTSLLTLTGTVAFRIYKAVMQAVQKTSDGHPFKDILDLDLTLPAERVHEVADVAVANANAALSELRRLFLVEDLVDTLKFGVGLWCLTYLGSWFNGMTLVIIGVVALFTLPKVYETNKTQIDQNLALVQAKINDITAKVKAAIPLGKKAEPAKEE
ncbi:reticulon-1 isoform X2 [Belonocnema kinseyi]|uniref:reticulon-1 isoform X2 n=1 Tax=Belonocnema kinseyi TaxID=2817044 RepID=UPI00143DAE4E|nr:reticulon-1 isoform X2 [Belonocnema kinseyi]